jgi:Arc/MetJ-type ribon-helix-helix transcriptional regulator
MSSHLSPENEQFINHAVEIGLFSDRDQALDEAVELLKRRQQILDRIDEGTRQLHKGEYTEYDEKGLRKFFDEVQSEGRKRYDASLKNPS